jgi:class 3 adenylate cyclase
MSGTYTPDALGDELDEPLFAEDDLPLFTEEDAGEPTIQTRPLEPFSILVVDDDPEVLAITRMAIGDLRVDGRPLRIVSALSGQEARERLKDSRFGLAILDVVMERPEAGLELAKFMRTLPEHSCTRVVLRTGQPGIAPEEDVLRAYDINDYWPKTELTAHRMRTLITGQLRSYRDMLVIERQRRDLLRVLDATQSLFRPEGSRDLIDAILQQLANLLPSPAAALAFLQGDDPRSIDPATFRLLAATGPWRQHIGEPLLKVLKPSQEQAFYQAAQNGRLVRVGAFGCFVFLGHPRIALMLDCQDDLSDWGEHAIELFCRNASTIFLNDRLNAEQEALLRSVERFVPAALVRLLGVSDVRGLKKGDHVSLDLGVLFADLHGFTTTAEKMSPEAAFDLLENTMDVLTPAIERHGGVIDKFLGDGLMALFPPGSDPANAVLEMHLALQQLNQERQSAGLEALRFGLGLHQGQAVVGALGHASRLELTAISDTVNVAARVERLTRTFGCSVLATDALVRGLSDLHRRYCRYVGMIPLRGRQKRTRVYHFFADHPDRDHLVTMRHEFEAIIVAAERGEGGVPDRVDGYLERVPRDPAASFLRGLQ